MAVLGLKLPEGREGLRRQTISSAWVLSVESLNIVPPLWDGSPYVTELPEVSRNHLHVTSSH